MNVKLKSTILLVLTCFFLLPANAQKLRRDHEQEIAVGVTGGMNFSRIKFALICIRFHNVSRNHLRIGFVYQF